MKTVLFLLALTTVTFLTSSIYSQKISSSTGPAPKTNTIIQNNSNDFMLQGTRYFSQTLSSSNYQFGKGFLESCSLTSVGLPFAINLPGGLVYREGKIYTWNQVSPYLTWTIDTVSGAHTLVFSMVGVPQSNLTGMYWDGVNMYGISTDMNVSQLFTVNMLTGVCSPIGSPSSVCKGAISLSGLGGADNFYVIDIIGDNLYTVNKNSGLFTLAGSLGVDANFAQDACFDPNDSTLYWMAYTTGPELRKLNLNGTSTVLCNYSSQGTGIVCLHAGGPPPNSNYFTLCRGGLSVPIHDNSESSDSVEFVTPTGCIVTDVNLLIDTVYHTWDGDLSFYLRKGGIGVKVIDEVGGSGDDFMGTLLNDSATTPIQSGDAPFTGSFIPSNPLSAFNGTQASGFWKLVVTDTAAQDEGVLQKWCVTISYTGCIGVNGTTVELPNYYSLNQNYPNPFNPVTKIKFGMPRGENVKLVVYDLLGREVKTLVNEYKNAGTYTVDFDGSGLSSGVYFYKLITPHYTETKRMLLIK